MPRIPLFLIENWCTEIECVRPMKFNEACGCALIPCIRSPAFRSTIRFSYSWISFETLVLFLTLRIRIFIFFFHFWINFKIYIYSFFFWFRKFNIQIIRLSCWINNKNEKYCFKFTIFFFFFDVKVFHFSCQNTKIIIFFIHTVIKFWLFYTIHHKMINEYFFL